MGILDSSDYVLAPLDMWMGFTKRRGNRTKAFSFNPVAFLRVREEGQDVDLTSPLRPMNADYCRCAWTKIASDPKQEHSKRTTRRAARPTHSVVGLLHANHSTSISRETRAMHFKYLAECHPDQAHPASRSRRWVAGKEVALPKPFLFGWLPLDHTVRHAVGSQRDTTQGRQLHALGGGSPMGRRCVQEKVDTLPAVGGGFDETAQQHGLESTSPGHLMMCLGPVRG
ncbi:hypothetical protein BKA81DRAFT_78185 [Phyllosticta paracitricarpa]|uniref:Uncharacterized protein n=1 Tax=Phyllosticta paracitricarpa TaxID=2016321 RepID=A0ABR1MZE7_9PEZI